MGLQRQSEFLRHRQRDDKQLREELIPILSIINHWNLSEDEEITLGGEAESFDAMVRSEPVEVTQANPEGEHIVRREVATGTVSEERQEEHLTDDLAFPNVLVSAINNKHEMHYSDNRHLIVVFDGDYSREDDAIVQSWVEFLRENCEIGTFQSIYLVERNRMKAFPVFE